MGTVKLIGKLLREKITIEGLFKKTFADVPDRIKDKVKEVLVDLDCPELAE